MRQKTDVLYLCFKNIYLCLSLFFTSTKRGNLNNLEICRNLNIYLCFNLHTFAEENRENSMKKGPKKSPDRALYLCKRDTYLCFAGKTSPKPSTRPLDLPKTFHKTFSRL